MPRVWIGPKLLTPPLAAWKSRIRIRCALVLICLRERGKPLEDLLCLAPESACDLSRSQALSQLVPEPGIVGIRPGLDRLAHVLL